MLRRRPLGLPPLPQAALVKSSMCSINPATSNQRKAAGTISMSRIINISISARKPTKPHCIRKTGNRDSYRTGAQNIAATTVKSSRDHLGDVITRPVLDRPPLARHGLMDGFVAVLQHDLFIGGSQLFVDCGLSSPQTLTAVKDSLIQGRFHGSSLEGICNHRCILNDI